MDVLQYLCVVIIGNEFVYQIKISIIPEYWPDNTLYNLLWFNISLNFNLLNTYNGQNNFNMAHKIWNIVHFLRATGYNRN